MARIALGTILAGAALLTLLEGPFGGLPALARAQPAESAQPSSRPQVYDEQADAKADIAAALVKAKAENRRVLIQWGWNECSWCILLNRLCTTDAKISRELLYEYDVVHVDIDRFNKNMDLAAAYGAEVRSNGAPYLTVLDSDGRPVANQETGSLESPDQTKPSHDATKVLDFLKRHAAPPLAAQAVLDSGLARAKAEGKEVFLHFGAPWCGWCHRLEDWMAGEDVARVLGRSFVPVKIDQDRMTGASEVFDRYNTVGGEGIPWTAFLDASGRVIVTSNGPDGNIGFPAADDEVAWFEKMLQQAGVPKADIATLTTSLKGGR